MQRLQSLFDRFLRERIYVNNITPATREWYECAWKAFSATAHDRPESSPAVTKADLQHFVITLRERGVKPVSCNTWLRALNAFCRWLHEEGETPALVKLAPQRLPDRTLLHEIAHVVLGHSPIRLHPDPHGAPLCRCHRRTFTPLRALAWHDRGAVVGVCDLAANSAKFGELSKDCDLFRFELF